MKIPGLRQVDEGLPEQLRDGDPLHHRVQREEVPKKRRHGNDRGRRKARPINVFFR